MLGVENLEWDQILEYSSDTALTEPACNRLLQLYDPEFWAPDLATSQHLQQETQEMIPLLDRGALWDPLQDLRDPESPLALLARGAVLEVTDLTTLQRWMFSMDSWVQTPREEISGELFKKAIAGVFDPFEPLRVLARVLTPEGELSENASPKMSGLNAEIRRLKKEIGEKLDSVLGNYAKKGVLQETYSDIRDGRYVLPVKSSHQGEMDGIIFGASASKQTVFIEPKEITPLNNALTQKQNELLQEIYVVLQDTSAKLKPFVKEIQASVEILVHWDMAQAKARIGRKYGGKSITVVEERSFQLGRTAHPALWWSLAENEIIRNDLVFEEPALTLLLTGPNTGGKTVLLKTLGLAAIFARTGFLLPGSDRPTVPFFDQIFADLGDAQSIEENISSFSGHVLKFKEILDRVTEKTLVLLDELNSATDPEEGAALGRAFLETLMSKNAMVVATTHDPNLKALAIQDARIVNASMAFDESKRTPTYRMIIGVPGRSRALETAERLGIPKAVLTLARQYLSQQHNEFENVISKLQADLEKATEEKKQATVMREEAEKLKAEWTNKARELVDEVLSKSRQRIRKILEQAQDKVREAVQKMDEAGSRKGLDETRKSLNQLLSDTNAQIEASVLEEAPELADAIHNRPVEPSEQPGEIQVGSQVRIPKWKSIGTVLEMSGSKVKVSMGKMQMSLTLSDVVALSDAERKIEEKAASSKKTGRTPISHLSDRPAAPSDRLDLRGVRFDEAMSSLERYLDVAFRSGSLYAVTIVHGFGTGAIREGTRKLLATLPYIKSFRDGNAGEGGQGATIVEFDQ